ncbi:hypothetical protein F5I97DRAFT_737112 [Phlebopus sp. FC_14]|nr:hypothetical protein F5I97DRAFT_737112 [Phlebopus sp. FC_14]
MKRSAENQLTKDGQYDEGEEIEEIEGPGQGFQKAEESVLAKRQIRALPKRAMAGPPAKAASFNGITSSPTSSTSAPEPPKAVFTFGTSTSDDSKSQKSGFSFTTQPSTAAGQARSIFGPSTKDTDNSVATGPPSQPTLATSVFGSSGVPNFFANSKTSATTPSDSSTKPMSLFGSSIFGSGTSDISKLSPFTSASDLSKTGDKLDAPKDASNSQASTSLFGGTTSDASTSSSGILPPDKPVSAFGNSSPPKASVFGFGKPSGSIGNPVGFGFGGPTSQGDRPGPSTGFTFGTQLSKPADNPSTTDKSTDSTPQPENNEGGEEDEPARLLPTSNHDEEGEGEEDEETMHVVKCKVFRLLKTEDKSEWKDFGVGMLRLKKHKQTGARRVLMRNSSTGRILINFRLYNGLRPTVAKTMISFIGHDNGTPASFRIRVKSEEQAAELKEAMDREIAALLSAA